MKYYAYEWPEHVSLASKPRATLKAIVPNLDRRTERWCPCYERLLEAGFPPDTVQRFSAFDYKEFVDLDEAQGYMAQIFDGLPSAISRRDMKLSNFCWLSTWYAMMRRISCAPLGEYWLTILDDHMLTITYNQLRQSIDAFNSDGTPATIIQVTRNPGKLQCRPMIAELDIWQHGLCGRTDSANILNVDGACTLIRQSNATPIFVPADAFERISYEDDQTGYYSLSAKYERLEGGGLGAAHNFISDPKLQDRLGSVG